MTHPRAPENAMSGRRHELLQHVVDVIQAKLGELGISAEAADLVANAAADTLADSWGGQLINIPTNYRWRLSRREAEIYNDYRAGRSVADIARRLSLHERSVRKIIDRIRARILAAARANNRDLFDE